MKIFLHEITQEETNLRFTQEDPWLCRAAASADEVTLDTIKSRDRPIHAEISLRKVDDVVVVSGKIETSLDLICSRCATPFHQACAPSFSALFCQDPEMAGVAYLKKQDSDDYRSPGRPAGKKQGFARHAHDSDRDHLMAEGKDLDITYLSHEYIDLGEVFAEQLQLQVPFQPLCKEACLGICSQCGTDLNMTGCTCNKNHASPFSALSDLKF